MTSKPRFTARRLSGAAVAAALAACGGAALAQQQPGYVTSGADKNIVRSGFGECVQQGMAGPVAAPCPPRADAAQVAQAGATRESARMRESAPAGREQVASSGAAGDPGYVTTPYGTNVRNPYGLCWHTGFWTPGMADPECDPDYVSQPVAAAPEPVKEPEPVAQPAPPPPEPAPAPLAAAPAPIVAAPVPEPRPMIQKVTIETDVLFPFDKAELRDSGRRKLDEIAEGLKGAQIEEVIAVGHTDRIGPASYNEKLSRERAEAVKSYLTEKGISGAKVVAEGRGKAQPVTGDACKGLKDARLIACLQPDRRVEIEVYGTREVAASEAPQPAAGSGASAR
ncbi:MAG TPA: OmpA family protein [Burkholderiales bacterium]|nr:OmpA family protein [Burkholderiales bacterium]